MIMGVLDVAIDAEPHVDVAPKAVWKRRLQVGRNQVDSQVSRPDRVGLLDDQVPARVEARRRSREGERDEQPKKPEDRALDRADALAGALRIIPFSVDADTTAYLEKHNHRHEQPQRRSAIRTS
jgi:hypothetical protein